MTQTPFKSALFQLSHPMWVVVSYHTYEPKLVAGRRIERRERGYEPREGASTLSTRNLKLMATPAGIEPTLTDRKSVELTIIR